MGKLAVILGSNALDDDGAIVAEAASEAEVLQRHGDPYAPPHLIDHAANLRALVERGCNRVLAIGSVGSLREELPVGSFLCPDDFIALQLGVSAFGDARGHVLPRFDPDWRDEAISAWRTAEAAPDIRDGGVYWQTIGPRFETPAEIRLLAAHADVVGMTISAECTIAAELGLRYAAVCVVDNLANGVGDELLTSERLKADRRTNAVRLAEALAAMLPRLAEAT